MKLRLTSIALLFAVMSALVLVPASSVAAKPAVAKSNAVSGARAKGKIGDTTINVTRFSVNAAGDLVASGTVTHATKGQLGTFSDAAVEVQQQPGEVCQILRLVIEPIFLNLLGLVVETSRIELVITADPNGGLLGALLCAIANLLNDRPALAATLNRIVAVRGGSLSSGSALTGMTPMEIGGFFARGDQLFASVFLKNRAGERVGPFVTTAQVQQGSCTLLRLVLGPIDIMLLGVRIQLFGESESDPVTITITAQEGPGNLLGNLLCGIARLLDGRRQVTTISKVAAQLNRIVAILG